MNKKIAAALAATFIGASAMMAQVVPSKPIALGSNPGIVMSGSASASDLPQPALKFISNNFPGLNISKVEREFAKGTYDVKFVNGTEMEFNNQGKVLEIDAPDGTVISPAVLQKILPGKAFKNLKRQGAINLINSVDFTYSKGKLVKVETIAAQPQDIVLDMNGNIVLVEVDD